MDFVVLGEVGASWNGRDSVALGGPRHRALLAILLVHVRRVVSVQRIIELLWGDEAPVSARNSVQGLVMQLRRALAGAPEVRLVTRAPGYSLDVPPECVDLFRFRRQVEAGRALAGDDATAVEMLRQALALWRGAPLADIDLPPIRHQLADALEQELLAALENRIELELRLGRHNHLVPELSRLAAEHPVRESVHKLLMLAQYRCGRSAEALETYRRLSARLAAEYGISSSPDLRRLHEAILRD